MGKNSLLCENKPNNKNPFPATKRIYYQPKKAAVFETPLRKINKFLDLTQFDPAAFFKKNRKTIILKNRPCIVHGGKKINPSKKNGSGRLKDTLKPSARKTGIRLF
ncbi:MAG: hypothetical protein R2747_05810 [Pyrinomonadaceae bacterium]